MSGGEFYLYSIVEGHGEVTSLPKLLHKIWGEASHSLRTDEEPYRVPKAGFFNNKKKRQDALNWAKDCVEEDFSKSGVLILMDADDDCCREFLQGRKMQAVCTDIKKILGNIPCVVVLIEKKYESWLAAGLDGGGCGSAEVFLRNHLRGSYRKTRDQIPLIGEMKIKRAAENNPSFRRFRERLLEWRGGG